MRSFSKEHREKLSKSHLGQKGYWTGKKRPDISKLVKGRKLTLIWKKKLSESLKGRVPWNKGKKLKHISEEHKRKISDANKGRVKTQKQWDAFNKTIAKGPTSIEVKLYSELEKINVKFEKQYLINSKFLVDAFIPSLNLVIEVDGNYWHNLDYVKKKDKAENAYLTTCGYQLMRISETDINNNNFIKRLRGIK